MTTFRDKLRHEVVKPVLTKDRTSTIPAIVLKVSGNTYTIKFHNEEGRTVTKSGIRVRQYGNDATTSMTFKENDRVLVEHETNEYTIIARVIEDEDKEKSSLLISSSMYSDSITDSVPGYIY